MKTKIIFSILLSLIGLSSAITQVNLDSGLVAKYYFNGNANDESGNNNNGTVNGANLTTDRFGIANSAYSFDGIDDYINILEFDNSLFTNHFSVSMWVQPNSLYAGNHTLIFNNNSTGFFLTQDGSNIIYYITNSLNTYQNFFSGSD